MQKDYFHIKDIEPQELMQLLLGHFGHGTNVKKLVHRFYHSATQHYLEVTFDENGATKGVVLSKDFPHAELEEIAEKIQDALLTKHAKRVIQIIGFCSDKVTGYFKYKDLFQILPISAKMQQTNVGLVDYPFILEVAYDSSPIATIDNMRRMRKATVYIRLLNLLANRRIFSRPRYAQFAWVLNMDDTSNIHSTWRQLEYVYTGLRGPGEDFSPVDHLPPIERVPFQTYYTSPIMRTFWSLTFPDDIEQSLEKALMLDKDSWNKFFMACTWYARYTDTLRESNSSAFIALVTALECLAQKKEVCLTCNQPLLENDEDTCSVCGQPRYRVTKHFQDFLKKHFPAIDSFPNEKRTLYQVRSQLAHGMDLLQADLEPWNFFIDAKMQNQDPLQRNLHFIAGIAMYNCLHSP